MPQIDFYIIKQNNPEARYPVLCRLVSKIAQQNKKLYIQCSDQKQAILIDDLLWIFNDISFIPHALLNTQLDEIPPILIGTEIAPHSHQDIVLNLSQQIPDNISEITRVLEIVCDAPEWKTISREHYKHYKNLEFNINTHTLTH